MRERGYQAMIQKKIFQLRREDWPYWETCQLVMDEGDNTYPLRQQLINYPEHLFKRTNDEHRGYQRLTLLHIVGCSESAQLLICMGLEVNAMDQQGNTPLHFAALRGLKEVVHILLSNGANSQVLNEQGESPLDWSTTVHIHHILQSLDVDQKCHGKSKQTMVDTVTATTNNKKTLGIHKN